MVISIKQQTKLDLRPLHQSVPVTFKYAVYFTTGLFHWDNPLLARTIAADGENTPKQLVAVVDAGLLQYWDGLLEQLTTYCKRYQYILSLRGEPLILPGGEAAKNNPNLVDSIHKIISEAGLCRHSYVLAIGGGSSVGHGRICRSNCPSRNSID